LQGNKKNVKTSESDWGYKISFPTLILLSDAWPLKFCFLRAEHFLKNTPHIIYVIGVIDGGELHSSFAFAVMWSETYRWSAATVPGIQKVE